MHFVVGFISSRNQERVAFKSDYRTQHCQSFSKGTCRTTAISQEFLGATVVVTVRMKINHSELITNGGEKELLQSRIGR